LAVVAGGLSLLPFQNTFHGGNSEQLLTRLKNGVNDTQKKSGKLHQVFEPSFECKVCTTNAFTLQKLNYIHLNPVSGK